jgi:hypothetical protein
MNVHKQYVIATLCKNILMLGKYFYSAIMYLSIVLADREIETLSLKQYLEKK